MSGVRGRKSVRSSGHTSYLEIAVALDALSAASAHEVTHALSLLRYLVEQEPADTLSVETTDFVRQEIERLQRLLSNLRRFKIPSPEFTPVALATVIRQSVRRVLERIPDPHTPIRISVPAHLIVHTNEACLRLALQNLLRYVRSISQADSLITVRAVEQDVPHSGPVRIDISTAALSVGVEGTGTLKNIWDVTTSEESSLYGMIARRMLHHIGWTLTDERGSAGHVFHLAGLM